MEENQQMPGQITPEQLAVLKQQAREQAIAQFFAQKQAEQQAAEATIPVSPSRVPTPPPGAGQQVVYVRRNLTIAELLLVLLVSCGIVTGIQAGWSFISSNLPRVEIKMK